MNGVHEVVPDSIAGVSMDDPVTEIPVAINAVAAALSPDAQIAAIERYFTRDASFLHPLCYVPPGPDSRRRVAKVYLFYRAMIPQTSFTIESVAFDEREARLFVSLVQRPEARVLRWFMVPALPMLIHFHLRRESTGGKWLIEWQEDLVQARSCFMTLPGLNWIGFLIYYVFELGALFNAFILTSVGVWNPKTLRHKVF